jgi:tRNA A37 N6-isopentenylltransferase MiaA
VYWWLRFTSLIRDPISGYKEFHDYLANPTLSNQSAFDSAVERMKLSTRQYARKQISWIKNKLLPATQQANAEKEEISFYLLNATGTVFLPMGSVEASL